MKWLRKILRVLRPVSESQQMRREIRKVMSRPLYRPCGS